MTLNFGVIGAGDFGVLHLDIMKDMPDVNIKWICVRNLNNYRHMESEYGAKLTDNLDDVLKDESVNAVSILTPEPLHYEQVLKSLEHGKDILVEKPVTTDPIEAAELAAKVKETGRIVLPGHISRFNPSYAKVRSYLEETGQEPVSIHARRNIPRERLALHNRIHPVYMALSHDIDLVLSYVNSTPVRVFGMERKTDPSLENPDIFWGLVEFENGCIVALENLWVLPTSSRYVDAVMEVAMVNEVVHVKYPGDSVWIDRKDGYIFPDPSLNEKINGEWSGALKNQIEYFVKCVVNKRKPTVVTMDDALRGITIAQALIKSAAEKRPIHFDKEIS